MPWRLTLTPPAPEFFREEKRVDLPDLGEVRGLPGRDLFITFRKAILLAGELAFIITGFFFSSN